MVANLLLHLTLHLGTSVLEANLNRMVSAEPVLGLAVLMAEVYRAHKLLHATATHSQL